MILGSGKEEQRVAALEMSGGSAKYGGEVGQCLGCEVRGYLTRTSSLDNDLVLMVPRIHGCVYCCIC